MDVYSIMGIHDIHTSFKVHCPKTEDLWAQAVLERYEVPDSIAYQGTLDDPDTGVEPEDSDAESEEHSDTDREYQKFLLSVLPDSYLEALASYSTYESQTEYCVKKGITQGAVSHQLHNARKMAQELTRLPRVVWDPKTLRRALRCFLTEFYEKLWMKSILTWSQNHGYDGMQQCNVRNAMLKLQGIFELYGLTELTEISKVFFGEPYLLKYYSVCPNSTVVPKVRPQLRYEHPDALIASYKARILATDTSRIHHSRFVYLQPWLRGIAR